ncbi:MAG: polysaccharide deacetylase family protein [Candidatus Heimdallarchaeaceae archaeon]
MPIAPVIFILHAYQPFNQDYGVLNRIVNNCYKPFFQQMLEKQEIKITLNLAGTLTEQLKKQFPTMISLLQELVERGQIELLSSAYYHPLLPLIDSEDQKQQIELQNTILQKTFGVTPRFFFPPELAISLNLIHVLQEIGLKGSIVPENLFKDFCIGRYQNDGRAFILVKRNKDISNAISFNAYKGNVNHVISDITNAFSRNKFPVVLAMDLETYGEHLPNYYNFFFHLAEQTDTLLLSEAINQYPINNEISDIVPSSWSTSNVDQGRGIYYPLWDHPLNAIHQLQQMHIKLLQNAKYMLKNESPGYWQDLAADYFAAQYSCQFWWAGNWWSKELVLKGINFQRVVLERITSFLDSKIKVVLLGQSSEIIKRLNRALETREKEQN